MLTWTESKYYPFRTQQRMCNFPGNMQNRSKASSFLQSEERNILSALSELLVGPCQHPLHHHARDNRNRRRYHHQNVGHDISRTLVCGEEVWAPDVSKLTEQIDDRRGTRPLLRRLVESRSGPAEDHGVGHDHAFNGLFRSYLAGQLD